MYCRDSKLDLSCTLWPGPHPYLLYQRACLSAEEYVGYFHLCLMNHRYFIMPDQFDIVAQCIDVRQKTAQM